MFTKQVHLLNRLRGRVDPLLIDVLWEMLGNCAATLEHRGPIEINYSVPQNFINADGTVSPGAPASSQAALRVNGPSQFSGPSNFSGAIQGALKPAQALADWQLDGANARVAVIGPVGDKLLNFWVYLPHKRCELPNLRAGDAIWYTISPEGIAIAPWYGSNAPIEAVAQADWEDNAGNPRVEARATIGGVAANHWVFLPCAPGQDPAVFEGDSIWMKKDQQGLWIAEGYGDDKIGTVKIWNRDLDDIPKGWRECGEDADLDMRGWFPVGRDPDEFDYAVAGRTGGFAWHGSSSGPGMGGENAHPDHDLHPNHRHFLDGTTYQTAMVAAGGDHNALVVTGTLWTSGADKLAGGADLDWGHTPHTGPWNELEDTCNRPPFKTTCYIERYK